MKNILLIIGAVFFHQFNSFGQYHITNASGYSIQVRVWEGSKLIYSHTMPTGQVLNVRLNEMVTIQYSYPRPYMKPPRYTELRVESLGSNWWQFKVAVKNKIDNLGVYILPPFIEKV